MMTVLKLWCIFIYVSQVLCCARFVDEVDLTALVHQPLWTKHTGRTKDLKMHLKKNQFQ